MINEFKLPDEVKISIEELSFNESSGQLRCNIAGSNTKVGYLNWMIRDIKNTSLEIVDFLIYSEENRQKGIGSILIKALKNLAINKGVLKIWGNTGFDDHLVHDFYKKHGYTFSEEVKSGGVDFWQVLSLPGQININPLPLIKSVKQYTETILSLNTDDPSRYYYLGKVDELMKLLNKYNVNNDCIQQLKRLEQEWQIPEISKFNER